MIAQRRLLRRSPYLTLGPMVRSRAPTGIGIFVLHRRICNFVALDSDGTPVFIGVGCQLRSTNCTGPCRVFVAGCTPSSTDLGPGHVIRDVRGDRVKSPLLRPMNLMLGLRVPPCASTKAGNLRISVSITLSRNSILALVYGGWQPDRWAARVHVRSAPLPPPQPPPIRGGNRVSSSGSRGTVVHQTRKFSSFVTWGKRNFKIISGHVWSSN
ncbi:hypothetical protein NDU88_004288 [Pleurodeles waltl]|uniref:Uncharacterized protein n=1 Tax=Pleurodeles waltl TaxID=8319 RepID=A0AAV7LHM2_PLEWA|nr:hypothetical protein NDU88_004288 [Pleurodeles waltl]